MTDKSLQKQPESKPAKKEQERMPTYAPRVDVVEGKEAVTITADMPGIDEKSVDIDLDRNILTLKGRFMLEAPEGFTRTYAEYDSGNYERVFTLSDEIDRGGIQATVKNGVLTLTLPKAKEAQPRKIAVKTG